MIWKRYIVYENAILIIIYPYSSYKEYKYQNCWIKQYFLNKLCKIMNVKDKWTHIIIFFVYKMCKFALHQNYMNSQSCSLMWIIHLTLSCLPKGIIILLLLVAHEFVHMCVHSHTIHQTHEKYFQKHTRHYWNWNTLAMQTIIIYVWPGCHYWFNWLVMLNFNQT